MKSLMSVTAWKFVLVSLALCCGLLNVFALTNWARSVDPAVAGTLGASFARDVPGRQVRVTGLDADSALRRVGVAVGDRLRFDHTADWARAMGTDEDIGLTLLRGATSVHVDVRPSAIPWVVAHPRLALITYVSEAATAFWSLFLGVMVALRNIERPALIAFGLAMISVAYYWFDSLLPGGSLQSTLYDLQPFAFFIAYAGMVYFSLRYVEDEVPWTRRWVRHCFTVYVVASLCAITYYVLFRLGDLPALMPPLAPWVFAVFAMGSSAAVWSALAWCWWHATGALRQRVAWTGVSMGLVYGAYFVINVAVFLGFDIPSAYSFEALQATVIFAAYLILAYGLLRHRLFDIGFAINRTVVFTILSTLLLLAFGLTEFAVDKLLHFEGREKNVIFDAVVALGVILSFHRIQHWVSHQVDHIFFKKWHAAAQALRHAMDKAAHIADPAVLRERFAEAVAAFAAGAGCAIYHRVEGAGFELQYGTLSAAPALLGVDDEAVLEMRIAGTWIYLDTLKTAARGQLAFPILSRGGMQGVVLVGTKELGQLYRPDELSLLAGSVQQLGQDLEVLRADALAKQADAMAHRADALTLEKQYIASEALGLRQLLQLKMAGAD
jgi:hypothetical protein